MQKEAEQRVREMQSRARLVGGGENRPSQNFHQQKSAPPQNSSFQNPSLQNPLSAVFGGLDNDKIIILALLWLLWNEHADSKLLLALLYLLL